MPKAPSGRAGVGGHGPRALFRELRERAAQSGSAGSRMISQSSTVRASLNCIITACTWTNTPDSPTAGRSDKTDPVRDTNPKQRAVQNRIAKFARNP